MKILEEGFGEDWKMQIRCECIPDNQGLTYDGDKEHCGSLLEIDKNDVRYNHWEKFRDEGHDYIVICPKCKCRLWLDPDKLPEWIKTKARETKKAQDRASNE